MTKYHNNILIDHSDYKNGVMVPFLTKQEQINKFMSNTDILTARPEWMDYDVYKLLLANEKKALKIKKRGGKVK